MGDSDSSDDSNDSDDSDDSDDSWVSDNFDDSEVFDKCDVCLLFNDFDLKIFLILEQTWSLEIHLLIKHPVLSHVFHHEAPWCQNATWLLLPFV